MGDVLKKINPAASANLSGKPSSPSSIPSLRHRNPLVSSSLLSNFHGRRLAVSTGNESGTPPKHRRPRGFFIQAQSLIRTPLKWWEKGLQPNMKEIDSAEDLVHSLVEEENRLVVLDFYSPSCGGCRALHPKLCQIAEMNPDVQFLQINYQKHKPMCYSLGVHVLPFFRFYRGAHGRLCSFSCTNATIKKLKDALSKHSTERCSLGPARGLEESEIMALAANKDVVFTLPKPMKDAEEVASPSQRRTHIVFSTPPCDCDQTSPEAADRELAASIST